MSYGIIKNIWHPWLSSDCQIILILKTGKFVHLFHFLQFSISNEFPLGPNYAKCVTKSASKQCIVKKSGVSGKLLIKSGVKKSCHHFRMGFGISWRSAQSTLQNALGLATLTIVHL